MSRTPHIHRLEGFLQSPAVMQAANKSEEGPRVDDLPFWACILDVPEAQLEFMVRMVGHDANAVTRYMALLKRLGARCHQRQ
jgi:hypothetical protein